MRTSSPRALTSRARPQVRTTQQKWLALIYFFVYIFGMFFIMVNIFLSILNDAYAVTKEGVEKQIEEKREEKARLVAERRAAEEEARKAGGRRTTPKSRLKRLKLWLTRKQKVA